MNNSTQTGPDSRNTLVISNVHLLLSDGWKNDTCLQVTDGVITALGQDVVQGNSQVIDAGGGYLLPGIIDLHGDAFERHITPRAGTLFPLELALAANDASLVANGITTFYYSITDGFEPGPRSRETVRKLLLALEELMPRFSCQAKVHIRHEKVNTEGHDELTDWLRNGRVHMLSLNDHLPELDNERAVKRYLAGLQRRVTMDDDATQEFLSSLQGRRELGEEQTRALASLALASGVSLSSHDDHGLEDVARNVQLGTAIAEFPMDAQTALESRKSGISVLMGAPNLVRGGSHVGAISVRDAIAEGLVDILCSDYHYPSLFTAPFVTARHNLLPLADAWKMVSENPARAAGMGDRKGQIASGYDADLLLLSELDGSPLSLQATFVGGTPVYQREGQWQKQPQAVEAGGVAV
ncbi:MULTISPECIES: alpha-D-ribose 1-methylphosphonate 5-triphosphate diphosphatase [Gammaproteobacteria]|uniref:Amidohydrolase 3 n=1 Tax=Marinobacter nauticus (strain ATCC 700491 / DSM 11845 / VT8) TaxID=351348 RepID=A1U2Z6_MARN8|nr:MULTISPECIES: alpha-D-ribose 1-methylphosphonate 5-triphosphate diphosphatase [Gammaproteobacteria]ABM19365.1 Amidohydrolase 3 [Marinobacter nauticus VT8]AXY43940.1 alpha-D-ribose 1-methylphosphonate 5-triphosphate diphosphatase [Halomonas sp. JS92-SW72]